MGRFFGMESPVMTFLSRLADLMLLNLVAMVCCIPIFTIGASMTALHYVVLKMVRNEEGYLIKTFFKSFKRNFKQATVIWLILLAIIIVLVGDFWIIGYSGAEFPTWLRAIVFGVGFLVLIGTMHVFPILSKFENTVKNTYKNSLFMGIMTLPKTVLMVIFWAIPIVVCFTFVQVFPLVFLFGISGPAYLSALLYNKTFKRFEPEEEEVQDEWFIEEETENPDSAEQGKEAERQE